MVGYLTSIGHLRYSRCLIPDILCLKCVKMKNRLKYNSNIENDHKFGFFGHFLANFYPKKQKLRPIFPGIFFIFSQLMTNYQENR